MLKEIAIITISVTNLAGLGEAYRDSFGYQVVEQGQVSSELAALWGAPDMAGQSTLLLAPGSGAPVYLRFVEDEAVDGYAPMTTWGWNATEILVSDPDAVAERLADSAFKIIGAPKDLWDAPDAPRALQALGPGNEVVYLTQNVQAEGAFELQRADFDVDRVFIMIVAGPSMEGLRSFYGDVLGAPSEPASPWQISVITNANGFDPATTYPLTVAAMAPGYLVELDEYPASLGARPQHPGRLPPGISVVSFTVDGFGDAIEWRQAPRTMTEVPYGSRSVGLLVGAAGEWIELIGGVSTDRK